MKPASDLDRLAEVISNAFPNIGQVAPLRVVGEGFRSVAVVTVGGALIRVGKAGDAHEGFALETEVLPIVRKHITATLPDPLWYSTPTKELPAGALGYPFLPGEIPTPGDSSLSEYFIPELAAFMVELHSISASELKHTSIRRVDPLARLLGARPVVMPLLAKQINKAQYQLIDKWWEKLEDLATQDIPSNSICHHDLWHENLLVDEAGHLAAVLDWSHIETGDPAHDFAAIHHFGPKLTAQLINEYRSAGGHLDNDALRRIQLYWEARHLGGLAWAIENHDEVETEVGVEKLLKGPLLGK